MFDLNLIKTAVTGDPLRLLQKLYGDSVKESDKGVWRVGSKGGKKFDILKGELLACDFAGDGENGDCFDVWQKHCGATFQESVTDIALLYEIGPGGPSAAPDEKCRQPRVDRDARLNQPLPRWPELDSRHQAFWRTGRERLNEHVETRERIAERRGWPEFTLILLSRAKLMGVTDFDLWPGQVRPQECAIFPVLHPERVQDPKTGLDLFHWRLVQLHCRCICSGAAALDGRSLSWIYTPTKKAHGMTEGANAPLVIARDGRDPEQPAEGTRCECVIICAGEWDALTVLLASGRINDHGKIMLPPGLAIVGIRGEGRGGTDAYLRHYRHWMPRSVVLLADADCTGATWFNSQDGRPCFAEQLEKRGAKPLRLRPADHKDVNDFYRTGKFGISQIEAMLSQVGFDFSKGGWE